MRDETVARSYAETLFELADRNDGLESYGEALEMVASVIEENAKFRLFLETPRISDEDRKKVVSEAFAAALPTHVLNFVLVTIDKRLPRFLQRIPVQRPTKLNHKTDVECPRQFGRCSF